ncbi:MAG: uracil-DNA glycosylase [Gemmatimonadaceae bacterium]
MSTEDLLRRYLEQRRELGESELVLDGMTVEEVMRLIGAAGAARRREGRRAPRPEIQVPRGAAPSDNDVLLSPDPALRDGDWRSTLSAAGATPPARRRPSPRETETSIPADSPPRPPEAERGIARIAPAGLVVGSATAELFGSFAAVTSVDELATLVRDCRRCPLFETATHGVPGEGDPRAGLMCVGEAPGEKEDATGRPFVGLAGQLLTKILSAIHLSREQVYIVNVLKHRPPGNRNPRPEEVDACSPYLVRQIELVRPKVIIAFGTFAAQALLETKLALGKLRGQIHLYHGVPVIVTYHPAALLRNPAWKRPTWEDVKLARRILDDAAA